MCRERKAGLHIFWPFYFYLTVSVLDSHCCLPTQTMAKILMSSFSGLEIWVILTGSSALVFLKNLAIKLSAWVVVSSEGLTGEELVHMLT